MNVKLSKAAAEILTRMRERPDWFMPVSQQELKACDRLAVFGLAERVPGGKPIGTFRSP